MKKRVLVLLVVAATMMVATAMPAFAQGGGPQDPCRYTTEETLDCKGGYGGGGYPEYGGAGGGQGGNIELDYDSAEGVQSGGGGFGGQNFRPGGEGHHCTGDFDDPETYECVGGGGNKPFP